ncbi:MAG: S41 family peptidase [Thermonemataceae bacterium]|nr:S41 family peptidase [Thermonemataceae bacterium]
MSNIEQKYEKLIVRLPIWLGLALAVGIAMGFLINSHNKNTAKEQSRRFGEVLSLIENNYVDSVGLDTLTEQSIRKILEKLDPHSAYFPPEDVLMAKSQLESDFEGIGVEYIWLKDTVLVTFPIPNSPALQAGIEAGDKIIAINGEKISAFQQSNALLFKKLRGKKGTNVALRIWRKGEIIEKNVIRDKIHSFSVYGYKVDKEVGYIKIIRFGEKTDSEFYDVLEKLVRKEAVTKLILDLRDNGGGYMDKASKIADEFLSGGELIVYTQGKHSKYDQKYFATQGGLFEKGKLIVLIDEGSASASEILAGALQDNDRATLVGRRSYGKGLVQVPFELSDGGELRLTVSKYYSPSGRCIQRPYKNTAKYDKYLSERVKNGELLHQDSIHYDKKQAFKTKAGKTVFGGGGISPDYFVALDSIELNKQVREIANNDTWQQKSIIYAQTYQKELKKMGLGSFLEKWEAPISLLSEISAEVAQNKSLNSYLSAILKPRIAKILWGQEAFIRAENQQDKAFLKALELMNSD